MKDAGMIMGTHVELENADDASNPQLPGSSWIKHKKKEALLRFLMAFGGGIALIGPMVLMVLHKSILTSLLTVTVSVFIFGLSIALFSDRPGFEIVTTTAGYAAVLVVFVGTSS